MSFKEPLSFSRSLKKGTHTLLLYEDKAKANEIRLNFIKAGLIQNQSCVYITTDDDGKEFEKSLNDDNIDMENIHKKELFHIWTIDNPFTNYGGFSKSIDKILGDISQKIKSPMRIACNIVGDIARISDGQLNNLLEKESCINNEFSKSNDYLLCTYYVENVSEKTNSRFLEGIKLHSSVIFAPKNSEGIGFNLD